MTQFIEEIREIDPAFVVKKVPIACPHCDDIFYRSSISKNWQCGKCRKNVDRDYIREKTIEYLLLITKNKKFDGVKSDYSNDRYVKAIVAKFIEITKLMKENGITLNDIKKQIVREKDNFEIILEMIKMMGDEK